MKVAGRAKQIRIRRVFGEVAQTTDFAEIVERTRAFMSDVMSGHAAISR
jgi:hypothetical protein